MFIKKNIENLEASSIIQSMSYNISYSIIENLDLRFEHFNELLNIENCIIEEIQLDAAWFLKGLVFKNNIVKSTISYETGGHNNDIISIEGNIFFGFFDFLDCHFEDKVFIKNNIFIEGTNLLGNKGKGFENTFKSGIVTENNIGNISISE